MSAVDGLIGLAALMTALIFLTGIIKDTSNQPKPTQQQRTLDRFLKDTARSAHTAHRKGKSRDRH